MSVLQFALVNQMATLDNFNPRVEKNGKERVPASDLKIRVNQTADVLAFFSPMLKHHLFDVAGPAVDLIDGLRLRDTHQVYPLKRTEEMYGAELSIDYGIGNPMVLADVKIKDFQLTPVEGGSVIVTFTAQCKPDPETQVPVLYRHQESGITISITPSELPEMKDAA